MDRMNLTTDELFELVRQALVDQEAAGQEPTLTTSEVRERLGLSEEKARIAMRDLLASGRFVVVWTKRRAWDGTMRPLPAIRRKDAADR